MCLIGKWNYKDPLASLRARLAELPHNRLPTRVRSLERLGLPRGRADELRSVVAAGAREQAVVAEFVLRLLDLTVGPGNYRCSASLREWSGRRRARALDGLPEEVARRVRKVAERTASARGVFGGQDRAAFFERLEEDLAAVNGRPRA